MRHKIEVKKSINKNDMMEFGGEEENQNGDESRFPFRLYNMLEQAHTEGYEAVVSWLPNGRAFRVHKRQEFM